MNFFSKMLKKKKVKMINKKDELTLSKAHYPDFFGLMSSKRLTVFAG